MITIEEYQELVKDPEMAQVLQRFMKPEQLKFELHKAELKSAKQSMTVNTDALWQKLYAYTICGDYHLTFSCGKNKVLFHTLYNHLDKLGYKVSRNQSDHPDYYTLDIEW